MKKIFALALAVAMVMSLASVAFAADERYSVEEAGNGKGPYKIPSSKVNYVDSLSVEEKGSVVSYGNTIYYPLFGTVYIKTATDPVDYLDADGDPDPDFELTPVVKYDAVKGIKISPDWSVGGDWVSKVEIVKKRWGASGEYSYFLAVTFKAAPTEAKTTDVVGEIVLKKSSSDNKINRGGQFGSEVGETDALPIDIELHYAGGDVVGGEITDTSKTFEFDIAGANQEDEEYEFTFAKWTDCTFTVDTVGQGKIVLKAVTDYNADIGALYPEANLNFFIGNGASFNKTGQMFISADEGTFIYEIKNGALVAIRGAEYDEYDEGFYFRTRTLGQYVVSDVELDLSAAAVVTPADPGAIAVVEPSTTPSVVVNPTTGAAV